MGIEFHLLALYISIYIYGWQHRFYGKSIPFGGDTNVAYSNASTLGYLSSTQALADYATLIIDLKKNLSATNSPVVVFGGSYGGSMIFSFFFLNFPVNNLYNLMTVGIGMDEQKG